MQFAATFARPRAVTIAVAAMLSILPNTSTAQWIGIPDPSIPRAADGTPNLTAPAPRRADGKPDLSGLWSVTEERFRNFASLVSDIPMQPWAEALYRQRQAGRGKGIPSERCLPHGTPGQMVISPQSGFKIVQTDRLVVMLFEFLTNHRQIFIDGRRLPADPEPTWFGYSVGRWEGDTLVVETTGFHDRKWLDLGGHPHSAALRLVERIRRINFGHLEMQITVDDPNTYWKPWDVPLPFTLLPDTELIEYICENEKDREHLAGR